MKQEKEEVTPNAKSSNSFTTKPDKYANNVRQEVTDQRNIENEEVDGIKSLYILKEDLINEYLGFRGWNKMIKVEDSVGMILDILDNFSCITKDEVMKTKHARSTDLQGPSLNIYVSLWRTLITTSKTKILSHKSVISTDRPVLL